MSNASYKDKLIVTVQKARISLWAFALLIYPPKVTPFVWSKLHRFLIGKVQQVYDGTARKRQAVSVGPQHGKSFILSKLAVAWMLGAKPGITIALTGFSHTLVTKFSKEVKAIINTRMYQLIFPEAQQVYGSDKAEEWELTNGSALIAKSAGSKLTGRRVDWLIIDDPHAGREEAESPTMRKKVINWYFADCITRLSPGAAVFCIQTRWHPNDLIGHLTSEEYIKEITDSGVTNIEEEIYEVTNIPSLCEIEEGDPLGRKVGEAAFPEVRTAEFLQKIKATIPAYEWQSQYQGRPRTAGSGKADISKIQYCEYRDVPSPGDAIWCRGWDLAITEDQAADYTAAPLIAFDKEKRRLYIVKMFRNQMGWARLKKAMFETIEEDIQREVAGQGIEAVAGFGAIYQEIKKKFLGRTQVIKKNPKRSKMLRAIPWINLLDAESLFLVRGPWNKDFLAELDAFPEGDNDDQVDGVSVAWEMIPKRIRLARPTYVADDDDDPEKEKERPNAERPKSRTRMVEI